MLNVKLLNWIKRLRSRRYFPNPYLEEDLRAIGCKTKTIEACGMKIVVMDVGDELRMSRGE